MKLKLTRSNGDVIEVEGTVEECCAVTGLASIGNPPPVHHHYHPAAPLEVGIGGNWWGHSLPPSNTPFVPSPVIVCGAKSDGIAVNTTGDFVPNSTASSNSQGGPLTYSQD